MAAGVGSCNDTSAAASNAACMDVKDSGGMADVFNFEAWVPGTGMRLAHEWSFPILASCLLYVPMILVGQWWMRRREPFKLKWQAFSWNMVLSLLSLLGAGLVVRDDASILLSSFYAERDYQPATRAVVALFTLTKAVEFGDTLFLVLKRKPLMFLHVYHHLTVAVYCWHAQLVNVSFAHNFVFINLCIHGVMYLYYALAVVTPGHVVLRAFRPYITLGQTLQMLVGMYISYTAIVSSTVSGAERANAWSSLLMYTSYAYLFGKFYLENYVKGVRPVMTLVVGTAHLMAVAGACIMWHHHSFFRLLLEVGIGYGITAVLFRASSDGFGWSNAGSAATTSTTATTSTALATTTSASVSVRSTPSPSLPSIGNSANTTTTTTSNGFVFPRTTPTVLHFSAREVPSTVATTAELTQFSIISPPDSCSGASLAQRVCRFCLMVLNCLAVWAREHHAYKVRLEALRAAILGAGGGRPRSSVAKESCTPPSSPSLTRSCVSPTVEKRCARGVSDGGKWGKELRGGQTPTTDSSGIVTSPSTATSLSSFSPQGAKKTAKAAPCSQHCGYSPTFSTQSLSTQDTDHDGGGGGFAAGGAAADSGEECSTPSSPRRKLDTSMILSLLTKPDASLLADITAEAAASCVTPVGSETSLLDDGSRLDHHFSPSSCSSSLFAQSDEALDQRGNDPHGGEDAVASGRAASNSAGDGRRGWTPSSSHETAVVSPPHPPAHDDLTASYESSRARLLFVEECRKRTAFAAASTVATAAPLEPSAPLAASNAPSGAAVATAPPAGMSPKKREAEICALPRRRSDMWLALTSFFLPAAFGLLVHGDAILGLTVHGALRWLLELHTTGALVPNMHIAKFESRKVR